MTVYSFIDFVFFYLLQFELSYGFCAFLLCPRILNFLLRHLFARITFKGYVSVSSLSWLAVFMIAIFEFMTRFLVSKIHCVFCWLYVSVSLSSWWRCFPLYLWFHYYNDLYHCLYRGAVFSAICGFNIKMTCVFVFMVALFSLLFVVSILQWPLFTCRSSLALFRFQDADFCQDSHW